jgi:hypothetical protein
VCRDRRLARTVHQCIQRVRSVEDAHRSHTYGGSTAVMPHSNSRRIGGLVEFPQRPHPRMDTLDASEHFSTDAYVRDLALREDGSCEREGPLRVVRRLANPPLTFGIPEVSRNDGAGYSFEASNTIRIPTLHAVP